MSKSSSIYSNLKLLILKERSLSFGSALRFVFNFIVVYVIFYLPLYLSIRYTIPPGAKFSYSQWWGSLLGAFILVVFTYFRENLRDKKKNKTIESDKIIYDCIGGAIQELHDIKFNHHEDKNEYLREILIYIEKVIESIFKSSNLNIGTLCVNFMINEDGFLKLTKFATKFQDRNKPKIKLDLKDPLPGAPEAWALKRVIYINDIASDKYKSYFTDDFKFKSFISIPLLNDDAVFGIINVDSNIKDQFVSDDFISKKIMPKINPILLLFVFASELFNNKKIEA